MRGIMNKAPCYTCTRRSEICHAQCVAYHEWAANLKRQSAEQHKTVDADAHTAATVDTIRKKMHLRRKQR